jgi:hypothetical protein
MSQRWLPVAARDDDDVVDIRPAAGFWPVPDRWYTAVPV